MHYIIGFLTSMSLGTVLAYGLDQDLVTEEKRQQFPPYYHQLSDQTIERLYKTYGPNPYAILGDMEDDSQDSGPSKKRRQRPSGEFNDIEEPIAKKLRHNPGQEDSLQNFWGGW